MYSVLPPRRGDFTRILLQKEKGWIYRLQSGEDLKVIMTVPDKIRKKIVKEDNIFLIAINKNKHHNKNLK